MSAVAFRFKVHTGPTQVGPVAALLRGQSGLGFDVFEGTENVWLSAYVNPEDYTRAGGPASYLAEKLAPIMGHKPRVTVHGSL